MLPRLLLRLRSGGGGGGASRDDDEDDVVATVFTNGEKDPENRLPAELGAPELSPPAAWPGASGNSPLLRLPPLPLMLLWNELICGHTSFTKFQ